MTFGFGVFIRAPLCSVAFILCLGHRWRLPTGEDGAAWARCEYADFRSSFSYTRWFCKREGSLPAGWSLYAWSMASGKHSVAVLQMQLCSVTVLALCQGQCSGIVPVSAEVWPCPWRKAQDGSRVPGFCDSSWAILGSSQSCGITASGSPGAGVCKACPG